MVDYYVICHKDSGTYYGFTTNNQVTVSEDCVLDPFMEDDYPRSTWSWDSHSRTYVKPQVSILTKREFLERFTLQERIGIRAIEQSDPVVGDFMTMLNISQEVDLSNDLVKQGLLYLVSINKLSTERVQEIIGVI
jgi:hypothetical protein